MTKTKKPTKQDRALAVARDVLKQIKTMPAECFSDTVYCRAMLAGPSEPDFGTGDDLAQHVDRLQPTCRVCHLGAVFLSFVRLYDGVPLTDVRGISFGWRNTVDVRRHYIVEKLADVFSAEQLQFMECAYEGDPYVGARTGDLEDREAAVNFGERYHYGAPRIAAIMKNVIRNKGQFVIPRSCYKAAGVL